MVGVVFGELVGLTGWFGEAVAFAAGEDVVEAGWEADAVAEGDDHGFDAGAGADRCSDCFAFVGEGEPGSGFFAEGFFVVVAAQDGFGAADGG